MAFFLAFIFWTFCVYWMHRFAHIHSARNILWRIHKYHHRNVYEGKRKFPKWYNFLFWFGSWPKTLDVFFIYTIPALIISISVGGYAYLVLVFHYIYEVFLADELLEHNLLLRGKITKFFAVGDYHMNHHMEFTGNYAFIFTFWDHIFGSKIKSS